MIRWESLAIDAAFLEEVSEDDDWRETIKTELCKLSGELNIKYLKEYINVAGTLYKHLPGWVLTRCLKPKEAQRWLHEIYETTCRVDQVVCLCRRLQRKTVLLDRDETTTTCIQVKCPKCSKTLSPDRHLQFPSRMIEDLHT